MASEAWNAFKKRVQRQLYHLHSDNWVRTVQLYMTEIQYSLHSAFHHLC